MPPQVTSVARKPLSIAFEEIAADKIEFLPIDPDAELEVVEVEVVAVAEGAGEASE